MATEDPLSQNMAQYQKHVSSDYTIVRAMRQKIECTRPLRHDEGHPEYTTHDMQNMKDIYIRELVIETISGRNALLAQKKGEVVPIEQPGCVQTQLRFWICDGAARPGYVEGFSLSRR